MQAGLDFDRATERGSTAVREHEELAECVALGKYTKYSAPVLTEVVFIVIVTYKNRSIFAHGD
jgi:hypothetical protein